MTAKNGCDCPNCKICSYFQEHHKHDTVSDGMVVIEHRVGKFNTLIGVEYNKYHCTCCGKSWTSKK